MIKINIKFFSLIAVIGSLFLTSAPVLAADPNPQDIGDQIVTGIYTEKLPSELYSQARAQLEIFADLFYSGDWKQAASAMVLGNGFMLYKKEDSGELLKTDAYLFPVYHNNEILFTLDLIHTGDGWGCNAIQSDFDLNDLQRKGGKFVATAGKYGFISIEEIADDDSGPFESSILVPIRKLNEEGSYATYRLYKPNSGEHLYTIIRDEKDALIQAGWKEEEIGWFAPKSGGPVYRLFNPNSGEHHYTSSENERNTLAKLGWKDEGTAFYGDGRDKSPVYRLMNPNIKGIGSHHYTTSKAEADVLIQSGWKDEGIGWFAQFAGC